MKRLLLISLLAVLTSNVILAADFQVRGISYNIKSLQDLTCVVTSPGSFETVTTTLQFGGSAADIRRPSPNLYSGYIDIPQTLEYEGRKLTVVGIDNCAFYRCEKLESVTIPKTVEYIGDLAFYECEHLYQVSGEICASIGTAAFYGCKALQKIFLSYSEFISHQAFQKCSGLTSITIPGNCSLVGEASFADCGNLENVCIIDGRSSLALYMNVFTGSSIKNLCIQRNLRYYSNSLSGKPFSSIVNISIGNEVTSLNEGVQIYNVSGFGFSKLQSELNEGYKSVLDVPDLKIVDFGASMKIVPAFEIAKLQRIYCRTETPPVVDGKFSYYNILNADLYVMSGCVDAYKAVSPWKDFVIKVS